MRATMKRTRRSARVNVTAGFDAKGLPYQGLPLAVTVVASGSGLDVRNGAELHAAGDVRLSSESAIKVSTRADSGLGGLPLAAAVSVLNSDVHTLVDGKIQAGDKAELNARGDMDAATTAEKGSGQESISGGYFSVAVALQDVKAEAGKHAVITAGGDVVIGSTAKQNIKTTATSGTADKKEKTAGGLTDALNLLAETWQTVKEKKLIESKTAQEKLDDAISKMATSSYNVKLAREASKKGEAKLSTSKADGKLRTEVQVTPWPGYKVKAVTARAMEPGKDKYTYIKDIADLSGKGKGRQFRRPQAAAQS